MKIRSQQPTSRDNQSLPFFFAFPEMIPQPKTVDNILLFFKWLKLKGVANCGARGSSAAGAECERAAART